MGLLVSGHGMNDNRMAAFELSFANGLIYLTLGRDLLSGPVTAHRLTP